MADTNVSEIRMPAPGNAAAHADRPRGAIAEWTVTILLLLFGTTTLVQAFVIPTGSMEDSLMIGDHLLVDKLAYSPPGPSWSRGDGVAEEEGASTGGLRKGKETKGWKRVCLSPVLSSGGGASLEVRIPRGQGHVIQS